MSNFGQSARQRVLSTYSVVDEITGYLTFGRDVSHFSLVNTTIHAVAARRLWRDLPSPWPLLRLFSSFQEHASIWQLKSLPTPTEVARFDTYASYTHSFDSVIQHLAWTAGQMKEHYIDPQSFLIIHGLSRLRPTVFPELRTVFFSAWMHCYNTACTEYIFKSPKISSIQLRSSSIIADEGFSGDELLTIFRAVSSTLTSLHLCGQNILSSMMIRGVRELPNLEYFSIDLSTSFTRARLAPLYTVNWEILMQTIPCHLKKLSIILPWLGTSSAPALSSYSHSLQSSPNTLRGLIHSLRDKEIDHLIITGNQDTIRMNNWPPWSGIRPHHVTFAIMRGQSEVARPVGDIINDQCFSYGKFKKVVRDAHLGTQVDIFINV